MSFDTNLPNAHAMLQKEARDLNRQIGTLQEQIDSGYDGGGCGCDCSACEDCEERGFLSDDEMEALEAELKPLSDRYTNVDTTIKRLERYAKARHIELEPASN
jgi:prefoldin subunit 5